MLSTKKLSYNIFLVVIAGVEVQQQDKLIIYITG